MSGLLGLGGGTDWFGGSQGLVGLRSGSQLRLNNNSSGITPRSNGGAAAMNPAVDQLREDLRTAASALAAALSSLRDEVKARPSAKLTARPPTSVLLTGLLPRLDSRAISTSALHSTVKVNTQSGNRSSTSGIGLDLSTSRSTLKSAALGLDLTTPARASLLRSAAALGLDLTSPNAASTLFSSSLGLDLTSPDAASVLTSALALGLDVSTAEAASILRSSDVLNLDITAPEAISRLYSAALGLDLTSPDAPSRLYSSAALGLDITSPQTASTLYSSSSLGLDITSPEAVSTLNSSAVVGLDVTSPQSASVLTSSAEINTAATSYAPSVTMSSGTSVASLSGVFTGVGTAAGMTSLKIKALSNVTLDSTTAQNVRFQIQDQSNTTLLDYTGALKAGDRIYLGDDIGLYLSFGSGTVVNNATGTSAVTRTATDVDPAALFNAAANSRPRFENGAQVTAGSFTINGITIAVNANDSINSVLSRINSSAAGVTAAFANDKITLTTNANSEDNIFLANDTSGFLAATKLVAPNEEINTASKSYGSSNLTFTTGTSTATLSGSYLGSGAYAAATSLIVKFKANGTVSGTASNVHFAVLDQANHTLLDTTVSVKAGDKVAIGNESGLWISFSAGSVVNNATSSTTVSNTKTDVDAAAVFNDSNLNSRPRFENGAQVTAGSFTVNGTSITVNANDSINSVLARINASAANVTASFANDRITIVNNGNSNPVILANDTSGFLAATKLSGPSTVKGNIRDDQQVLAKTTQFASVSTGSFVVDGQTININVNTDTVQSIVDKINASGARVTASYNSAQDKFNIVTTYNTEDNVPVGTDTTGFLTAAKLSAANTVKGNLRDDQQVFSKTSQFASVNTGSFTVNGAAISVNKDTDTLTSIMNRINASAAGVTATFDSTLNKLKLVTNANSEDLITVSGDTSSFLTAAKLSTNNTVRGNIIDTQQALSRTSQFGSVASGSFTINGVSISVNATTDTVASMISKINSAGAGVTASYDSALDKLVLTGTSNSEDLIAVASDTSGFLTAAKLSTGNTIRGHLREDTVALYDLSRFSGVTDGHFSIDGHTINITTADTIQSILTKINQSGARVTASFDSAANKLRLDTTFNTEDDVSIGSDTSGFLSAAGIDSGNTIAGNLRDDQQILSKTGQFGDVASGSFTINGVAISIDKDADTLTSVIARINSAGAGVTAAYDEDLDKVVLTSESNTEDLIAVENDTTGFVSSAKLATSETVRGNIRDDRQVLSKTTQFAAVSSGSFTVNGVEVQIDKDADSLSSIIDRINDADAGVTASYDAEADKIVLTGTANSEDLIDVSSDTTGFLAAAELSTGNTVRGHLDEDTVAFKNLSRFAGVTSGSFTVDGKTIDVTSNDTIQSVVAKINDSGARVIAAFDAGTNKLNLTTAYDTQQRVPVGSDTSGFLAAAGLSASSTLRGHLREDTVALADTDSFQAVQDGSFVIDGQTITVDADTDTIQSLIDKINASGARLTASYDEDADKIVLAATYDSEDPVELGSDTSGFLNAAHLDSDNSIVGNIRDDLQVLAKTTQFGAVGNGSFTINGHGITVDTGIDSLESLIQKINDAGAGVTAALNETTNRIELTNDAVGADPIVVEGDTSGFLAIADLDTAKSILGKLADDQAALSQTAAFAGVTDGTFTINGSTISIDADHDTLQSILGKIEDANLGVAVSYDDVQDRLLFSSTTPGATLSLENDTTGFLNAAHVQQGTLGGVANPDGAFDAASGEGPLFDPGQSVHSGSFKVNGVSIDVAADDTIHAVLEKITNSDAGVTASFDDATQKVTLISKHAHADPVTVSDDTSGFLTAVKLDGTSESGSENVMFSPFDSYISDLAEYSQVHSGSLTLNGRHISVDPAKDTIHDVAAALDNLDDITASVNDSTGAVQITGLPGESLELSDSSGLLADLQIASQLYRAQPSMRSVTGIKKVTEAVERMNSAIASLFGLPGSGGQSVIDDVSTTVQRAVNMLSSAGISVVKGGDAPSLSIDPQELAMSLRAMSPNQKNVFTDAAAVFEDLPQRVVSAVSRASFPSSSIGSYLSAYGNSSINRWTG